MARMPSDAKNCISVDCNVKLTRTGKKATQYCDNCRPVIRRYRKFRYACRIVRCRSPAKEDGYCEACRPFPKDMVPVIHGWNEGKFVVEDNNPVCPYAGTPSEGETYRCADANEVIKSIRSILND